MKRRDFLKGLIAGAGVLAAGKVIAKPVENELRFGKVDNFGFYENKPRISEATLRVRLPTQYKQTAGNRILTVDEITRESLRILHSKMLLLP